MNKVIKDKLNEVSDDKSLEILNYILEEYNTPSFGSMSKHDIDLLLFSAMIKSEIIKADYSIYDVMSCLKVTRSKARNLIYEYQLRKVSDENELKKQLCAFLENPIITKDANKISLEIDNPYMIDYVRKLLKDKHYLSDGSFHAEIVTMSIEAFSEIYVAVIGEEETTKVHDKFVELGIEKKVDVKTVLKKLIKAALIVAGDTAMGEISKTMLEKVYSFIDNGKKNNFGGNTDSLFDCLRDLLKGNKVQ